MSPPPAAEVRHVLAGYSGQVRRVRLQVATYLTATWNGLPDYQPPNIHRFAVGAARAAEGGQRQTAALTDRYLATVTSALTGRTVRPVGVNPRKVTTEAVRGVAGVDLYERTGPTVYWELSRGKSIGDAAKAGLNRALVMAATDLQLAKTHAALDVLSRSSHVDRYTRVPTGGAPCDLCDAAADESYASSDLMPIHDNCSCDVLPVIGEAVDVPTAEPDDRLGDSDVEVHDHDEIGPVLTVADQHFSEP
jgi:hypothetical protein